MPKTIALVTVILFLCVDLPARRIGPVEQLGETDTAPAGRSVPRSSMRVAMRLPSVAVAGERTVSSQAAIALRHQPKTRAASDKVGRRPN